MFRAGVEDDLVFNQRVARDFEGDDERIHGFIWHHVANDLRIVDGTASHMSLCVSCAYEHNRVAVR